MIDTDDHNKIIIQCDSLYRLEGDVDLFICDEFVDLSSQLLGSSNRNKEITPLRLSNRMNSIESFNTYLQHSKKRLIMDANLDRVDYFKEIPDFDFTKSAFIKDCKIYHSDKRIIEYDNEAEFTLKLLEVSEGRLYVPADTRIFIDNISTKYKEKYPNRKVLVIHGRNGGGCKKEDWNDYDAIFCSPSITAGVSHTKKIDHVYAHYEKNTITAWSASQQLLRCRNWETAHIYFGKHSDSTTLPVNDSEIDDWINSRFFTEILDFPGIKIDRIKKGIIKNFTYYMYFENLKKMYRSRCFFRYYFLDVLKRHGITSVKQAKDLYTKKECEEVKRQMKVVEYNNEKELICAISKAEPTDEDFDLYEKKKFDHLDKAIYEKISLAHTYGFCLNDKEWIETYINKKTQYKNLCKTIQEYDNPTPIDEENYNTQDINEQNRIQRRKLCLMMLKASGFKNITDESTIQLKDELKTFVTSNLDKIQVIFNSHKTVELKDNKALMRYVNSKLTSVYGIKLSSKDKMFNKVRTQVYYIDGMDIWDGENKPSIRTTAPKALKSLMRE